MISDRKLHFPTTPETFVKTIDHNDYLLQTPEFGGDDPTIPIAVKSKEDMDATAKELYSILGTEGGFHPPKRNDMTQSFLEKSSFCHCEAFKKQSFHIPMLGASKRTRSASQFPGCFCSDFLSPFFFCLFASPYPRQCSQSTSLRLLMLPWGSCFSEIWKEGRRRRRGDELAGALIRDRGVNLFRAAVRLSGFVTSWVYAM